MYAQPSLSSESAVEVLSMGSIAATLLEALIRRRFSGEVSPVGRKLTIAPSRTDATKSESLKSIKAAEDMVFDYLKKRIDEQHRRGDKYIIKYNFDGCELKLECVSMTDSRIQIVCIKDDDE